jgi:hypothetical protein
MASADAQVVGSQGGASKKTQKNNLSQKTTLSAEAKASSSPAITSSSGAIAPGPSLIDSNFNLAAPQASSAPLAIANNYSSQTANGSAAPQAALLKDNPEPSPYLNSSQSALAAPSGGSFSPLPSGGAVDLPLIAKHEGQKETKGSFNRRQAAGAADLPINSEIQITLSLPTPPAASPEELEIARISSAQVIAALDSKVIYKGKMAHQEPIIFQNKPPAPIPLAEKRGKEQYAPSFSPQVAPTEEQLVIELPTPQKTNQASRSWPKDILFSNETQGQSNPNTQLDLSPNPEIIKNPPSPKSNQSLAAATILTDDEPWPFIANNSKVIILGDSIMFKSLASVLEKRLSQMPVSVNKFGGYEIGFSRPDIFNWSQYFDHILSTENPELAFVSIGVNDAQDLTDKNLKVQKLLSQGWIEEYGQRVATFLHCARERNVRVIWVGLPEADDDGLSDGKLSILNQVTQSTCGYFENCRFFSASKFLPNQRPPLNSYLFKSLKGRQDAQALAYPPAAGDKEEALGSFFEATPNQAHILHINLTQQNSNQTHIQRVNLTQDSPNQARIQRGNLTKDYPLSPTLANSAPKGRTNPAQGPYLNIGPDNDFKLGSVVNIHKVLLIADSQTTQGLKPALRAKLQTIGANLATIERDWGGLGRADRFNWNMYLSKLIEAEKPDLIFLSLGQTESKEVTLNADRLRPAAIEARKKLFSKRAEEILALAKKKNILVLWAGLPELSDKVAAAQVNIINELTQSACQSFENCLFLPDFIPLALNEFQAVRTKDGLALTESGAKLSLDSLWPLACLWAEKQSQTNLADNSLPKLGKRAGLNFKAHRTVWPTTLSLTETLKSAFSGFFSPDIASWRGPTKLETVILAGDSMMLGGVGLALQSKFKSLSLNVSMVGRESTGLTSPSFFDWPAYFQQVLDERNPELVFVSLGANDAQNLVDENRQIHKVLSDGWKEHYGRRVAKLLSAAKDKNVLVFWIGLPVMGREPYNTKTKGLNEVIASVCHSYINCQFFDSTKSLLSPEGRYSGFVVDNKGRRIQVRAKDAIHLSNRGGQMLLEDLWPQAWGWTASYVANDDPKDLFSAKRKIAKFKTLDRQRLVRKALPEKTVFKLGHNFTPNYSLPQSSASFSDNDYSAQPIIIKPIASPAAFSLQKPLSGILAEY